MEHKAKIQWKKWFRKGYDSHGYHSPEVNGKLSKSDAEYTRSKLKRMLDKLIYSD